MRDIRRRWTDGEYEKQNSINMFDFCQSRIYASQKSIAWCVWFTMKIETMVELLLFDKRGGYRLTDSDKTRHFIIWHYYNGLKAFETMKNARKLTKKLNESFKKPLGQNELYSIFECIDFHNEDKEYQKEHPKQKHSNGLYWTKKTTIEADCKIDLWIQEAIGWNVKEKEEQRKETRKKTADNVNHIIAEMYLSGKTITEITEVVGLSWNATKNRIKKMGLIEIKEIGGSVKDVNFNEAQLYKRKAEEEQDGEFEKQEEKEELEGIKKGDIMARKLEKKQLKVVGYESIELEAEAQAYQKHQAFFLFAR